MVHQVAIFIDIAILKIIIELLNLCCESSKYGTKNSTKQADFSPFSWSGRNSLVGRGDTIRRKADREANTGSTGSFRKLALRLALCDHSNFNIDGHEMLICEQNLQILLFVTKKSNRKI